MLLINVDSECCGLAGGERFAIGTGLAPRLGIRLEGVGTNSPIPEPSLTDTQVDTDGGQRLLRGAQGARTRRPAGKAAKKANGGRRQSR